MNRLFTGGLLAVLVYLSGCSAQTASSPVPTDGAASTSRSTQDVLGGAPPRGRGGRFDLFDAAPAGDASGASSVTVRLLAVSLLAGAKATPWVSFSTPQDVDLLQLQSEAASWSGFMAAGSYNGIQLAVDPSHSYVVIDGVTYPMSFKGQKPNATSVAINASVPAFQVQAASTSASNSGSNAEPRVALDFNVLESLQLKNGVAVMDPKLVGGMQAASIHGKVQNAAGKPVALATVIVSNSLGSIVNTTLTKGGGDFQLNGIMPGTYTLQVLNSYTSSSGDTVTASGNDPDGAVTTSVTINAKDIDLHQLTD